MRFRMIKLDLLHPLRTSNNYELSSSIDSLAPSNNFNVSHIFYAAGWTSCTDRTKLELYCTGIRVCQIDDAGLQAFSKDFFFKIDLPSCRNK